MLSITCQSSRISHAPSPSPLTPVLTAALCSTTSLTHHLPPGQLQEMGTWPKIQLCSKPRQQQGWKWSPHIQGQMPTCCHHKGTQHVQVEKPPESFLLALLGLGLQLPWEEPECKGSLAVSSAHPLTCCCRVPESFPAAQSHFPTKHFSRAQCPFGEEFRTSAVLTLIRSRFFL